MYHNVQNRDREISVRTQTRDKKEVLDACFQEARRHFTESNTPMALLCATELFKAAGIQTEIPLAKIFEQKNNDPDVILGFLSECVKIYSRDPVPCILSSQGILHYTH